MLVGVGALGVRMQNSNSCVGKDEKNRPGVAEGKRCSGSLVLASLSSPRFRTLAVMWSVASSSQPSFQLWPTGAVTSCHCLKSSPAM